MKALLAVILLSSCSVIEEAGEGLAVGLGAAGGSAVGGPVGATLGATATHLAFKAADGVDLQEEINDAASGARSVEYISRTWTEFFKTFKWSMILVFILVLFFNPKWLVSVPIWITSRVRRK